MDSIFLAFCTADIGFIGMLTISFPPGEPTSIVISIILTINLFLFSGNSRVIIAYVKYKRWETIVLKITIILGLLDYLVLAAYFMRNSFSAIPLSPDVVENFQEFFFLYIFGMFTLYM